MKNDEDDYLLNKEDSLFKIFYESSSSSSETKFLSYIGIVQDLASHTLIQEKKHVSIRFYHLSKSRLDKAIDILIQKLLRTSDTSVHGMFDGELEIIKEFEELYRNIFTDGFSVIAIDQTNGEVMGVAFIKIRLSKHITDDGFYTRFLEDCQNDSVKQYINSLIKLETYMDHCFFFHLPYYFQIMEIAVLLKYEQTNLLGLLLKAAVALSNRPTSEQLEKIKMQISSTSIPFEKIFYMPPIIVSMSFNEDMKEFLTKFDFIEMGSIPYEHVDMNIPDILRPKYKDVCFMIHWKRTAYPTIQQFPTLNYYS